MKKILFLLLLFSGYLQSQITPCPTYYTKKYDHKVDSTFLNASGDSIIVVDNGVRSAIPISKTFRELNRFHVDPNGNDNNIGADESPVLTVAKGLTLLGQGDILLVGEGVYNETLTMSVQNTGLSGETALYGSLSQIGTLNVTTASGTSNKISDLTIATLNHTGGAPLYVTNSTVSGALTKNNASYIEIRNSSLQGVTNNFTGGSGLISNTLIGNTIINSGGYTIKDVTIDPGDSLVIKSGTVYNIQNVTGKVVIEAGAIPMSTALQGLGLSAEYSKAYETDYANKLAMINPDSVATSANVVVWNRTTKRLEYTSMPPIVDTTSLSNRINQKVSYTDTASMLLPYLRKNDTASLSNRIDKKVDSVWYKSDTMFVKTKNGTTAYPQTKYVDSIYQNTAKDSLFWNKNGVTYGYKLGGGSTQDTTSWFYRLRQLNDSTVVWDRKNGTSDTVKFSFKCCEGGGSSFDTTYIYSILNKKVDTIYTNSTKDTIFYTRNGVVTKFPIGGESGTSCNNVYFDSNDPATATIFDTANPPVVNDDALKNLSCATYFGLDGSVWTSDGTTYKTKVFNVPLHQSDVFIATAGQTTFILPGAPIGKLWGYRNGVKLPTAWTWVGNTVTYIPANNGSKIMDAGDIISFETERY
jgi:hypothetical protein